MLIAFLGGLIGWLRLLLPIWVGLVVLELAFPGDRVPFSARLRGLALTVVYIVCSEAIIVATWATLSAIGVRPLFQVHAGAGGAEHMAFVLGSTLFSLFLADLLIYWLHRLQHRQPLWRQHAVHHAVREMNALSGYPHWTEEVIKIPFVTLPVALLTPSGLEVAGTAAILVNFLAYFTHANSRVTFGPLRWLIIDNRYHRIHHSMEPKHFDKNFGGLTPLWDWAFGTLYMPAADEWPDTGLADQAEADGLWDYLWRPFNSVRRA